MKAAIYARKPSKFWVYALTPPDSNDVRYIGFTGRDYGRRPCRERLNSHMGDARRGHQPNKALADWLLSLDAEGRRPKVVVLGVATTRADAVAIETAATEQFRPHYPLFNISTGFRLASSTRQKQSDAAKGKPKSAAHRRALGLAQAVLTPEQVLTVYHAPRTRGGGAVLARQFNISPQLVCDIQKGRRWAWLTGGVS